MPLRERPSLRNRSAVFEWHVRVRPDLVSFGVLQWFDLRDEPVDVTVWRRWRRLHCVRCHRQRLHRWTVPVRNGPRVRRGPTVLGRHLRVRPDVVSDRVLQRLELRDGAQHDAVRERRKCLHGMRSERRPLPQRKLQLWDERHRVWGGPALQLGCVHL